MKVISAVVFACLTAACTAKASSTTAQGIDLVADVNPAAIFRHQNESWEDDVRRSLERLRVPYAFDLTTTGITIHVPEPSRLAQARAIIAAVNSEGAGPNPKKYTITPTVDGIALTLTEAYKARLLNDVAHRLREIIARRFDVPITAVRREGMRITVRHEAGRDYRSALLDLFPPKLSFRWAPDFASGATLPDGVEWLEQMQENDGPALGPIAVEKRVLIDGDAIRYAGWTSHSGGEPVTITLQFNEEAGQIFADLTKANIGKRFAVVMGNKVLTAPTIGEPILGGSLQIEGDFTVKAANELAAQLRAGALPDPLIVLRCALKRDDGRWEPCPAPELP